MNRTELFNWLGRRSRRPAAVPNRKRLRIEALADRRVLAITVDTLTDEADGSITDGDISLRDAIAAAVSGETIDFSVTGTILLDDALGELVIDKSLMINGPGAELLTIPVDIRRAPRDRAVLGPRQPGQHPQQRRFTGPVRAVDGQQIPGLQCE